MMKKTFVLFASMMALAFANVACIENGQLPEETPDAAVPPTQPDACPTPVVDATVTPTVDAMVPVVDASAPMPDATPVPAVDASVPTPDATPPAPDAAPVSPDASCPPPAAPTLIFTATPTTITVGGSSTLSWSTTGATSCALGGGSPNGTVVVTPIITTTFSTTCFGPGGSVSAWVTITVNPAPECVSDSGCNDGLGWTGDSCSGGSCVHWPTDCGGMQVHPSVTAVSCQFWAGYGSPEPAPSLGTFAPGSLSVGTAGGDWKASPASACSVKCYNSAGAEVALDIQIEWNGATFLHQLITGLHKGTWDGHNTY